jgi:hypothetical protein
MKQTILKNGVIIDSYKTIKSYDLIGDYCIGITKEGLKYGFILEDIKED